jgi:hypothetical protein
MPAQPNGGPRPGTPTPQPVPVSGEVRVLPGPRPALGTWHITPEVVALVDELEATWAAEPRTTTALAEPEAGS